MPRGAKGLQVKRAPSEQASMVQLLTAGRTYWRCLTKVPIMCTLMCIFGWIHSTRYCRATYILKVPSASLQYVCWLCSYKSCSPSLSCSSNACYFFFKGLESGSDIHSEAQLQLPSRASGRPSPAAAAGWGDGVTEGHGPHRRRTPRATSPRSWNAPWAGWSRTSTRPTSTS